MTSSPPSPKAWEKAFVDNLLTLYPKSELKRAVAPLLRSVPQERFRVRYRNDPTAFARDCFTWPEGERLTPYQEEVLSWFGEANKTRVALRSPHGTGKTFLASALLLWFALTRDQTTNWKAVTTAGAWVQLTHYLWPEIHKGVARLNWSAICREPFKEGTELALRGLRLATGEAFAVASSRSNLIEGAHAESLLYIYDESKSIIDATFDAAEGAFASPELFEAFAFAPSTPGAPIGRFYEIHARRPGYEDWRVRHVTVQEAIDAGRIAPEWVEARRAQWGEGSALFQNRVLGEFADEQTSGVIPLSWVERAVERWREWQAAGFPGVPTSLGVDVSMGAQGGDYATISIVYDRTKVRYVERVTNLDPNTSTMELAGRVAALMRQHKIPAYVDVIGVGAGITQRLVEMSLSGIGFNAARGTALTDSSGSFGFANWRAAMWYLTRELLSPDNGYELALPPDDGLEAELTLPQFKVRSDSKILVEDKDSLRRRFNGRSTDSADAVLQALIGPVLEAEELFAPKKRLVYRPYRVGG